MKTAIVILAITILFNFSVSAVEPRGIKFEEPIKGLLLMGKQVDKKFIGGVVFLTDDGTIYSADSVAISADRKSMIFMGRPLEARGNKRMFTDDPKAWLRLSKGGKLETSKSKWQMTMPAK